MNSRSALVVLAGLVVGCSSSSSGGDVADPTLSPAQAQFGKTYGEWGGEWWKWIFRTHDCGLDPIADVTGEHCATNQDPTSSVFFLTGTYGGNVVRDKCAVPKGKALFFPILNTESDNAGVPMDKWATPDGLKTQTLEWVDRVVAAELVATLDGVAIPDLTRFRVSPAQFAYTLPPEPNVYSCSGVTGVTGDVTPAFTAGYYVMLAPPAAGAHTLHFAGKVKGTPTDFQLDVTFKFTIQ